MAFCCAGSVGDVAVIKRIVSYVLRFHSTFIRG